jgi:hypothetical protein
LYKRHDPRLRALVDQAVANGATWRGRNGPHYILRFPSGRILTFPGSPSDWRAGLNKLTELRRILREEGILQ